MYESNRKKLVIGSIVACIVFVVVAVAMFMYDSFRPNPYGNEIKIDNFTEYFKDVPRDTTEFGFSGLYEIVYDNADDKSIIKGSGALVREGSVEIEYDEGNKKPLNATFIVDVPFAKQSYKGFFDWGNRTANYGGAGYKFIFSCLPEEDLIYGNFSCVDMFSSQYSEIPICNKLPVMVSDYDVASRSSSNYSLSCYYISENVAKILVNDFTGGNYENALEKIREFGFDPNNYEIEYNNQGGDFGN